LSILACLMLFSAASGQSPPGYMGKRLILNYNNLSFPSVSHLLKEGEFIFKYKHNFELEYIVARHKALGLSVSVYDVDIPFDLYDELQYETFDPLNSYSNYNYYIPKSGVISAVHAGIYYKVSHANVAPIGVYSQFEIDQIYYSVKVDTTNTSNSSDAVAAPNLRIKEPYQSVMVSYAIGTQRVMFDILVLRFALKASFVFGGLKATKMRVLETFNPFYQGFKQDNYIKRTSKNTLLNHNLINVTLGIGILAY